CGHRGSCGIRGTGGGHDSGAGLTCCQFLSTDRPMTAQSDAERELAQLLVESLNLEDVAPESIDPEAPLFNAGLGLDSIDALELALAISKRYGFQLRSDDDQHRQIFASLRARSAPGCGGWPGPRTCGRCCWRSRSRSWPSSASASHARCAPAACRW